MEKIGEKLRLGFVDEPDYSVLEAFRYIVSGKDYTGKAAEVVENPAYNSFLDKLLEAMPSPFDIDRDEAAMLRDLVNEYIEVFGITDDTPEVVKEAIEGTDRKWNLPDIAVVQQGVAELTGFIEH